jgi:aspartate racemase
VIRHGIPRVRRTILPGISMKTIGLLGGLSWESSLEYYRLINQKTRERLGGLRSAPCILYSLDFAEIELLQRQGRWEEASHIMSAAAQSLERAGADILLICSNTMHKMADELEQQLRIPLLHIADATAEHVVRSGISTVALLGTRFTMEEEFYKSRLEEKFGLRVLVPPEVQRQLVHDVIYHELCAGIINPVSRKSFSGIIQSLALEGAQGVILGCTEIVLLVKPADSPIPVFDTTELHAEAAVNAALRH